MQRNVFLGIVVGFLAVAGVIAWLNLNSSEASGFTTNSVSTFTRSGKIIQINDNELTLSTEQGEVKVTTSDTTKITNLDEPITLNQLAAEDSVTITYTNSGSNFLVQSIQKNNPGSTATVAPGNFNLTVIPLCNGNQAENLLSWTASENAFEYTVVIDDQAFAKTQELTYNHRTNLTAGEIGSYKVVATNSLGQAETKKVELTIINCQ